MCYHSNSDAFKQTQENSKGKGMAEACYYSWDGCAKEPLQRHLISFLSSVGVNIPARLKTCDWFPIIFRERRKLEAILPFHFSSDQPGSFNISRQAGEWFRIWTREPGAVTHTLPLSLTCRVN